MINNTPHYAGFCIRFVATLIDTVLALIIITPFLLYRYGFNYSEIMSFLSGTQTPDFMDIMLSYVFPILATLIFWRYRAATPGKMLCSIVIVDAKTLQKPILSQFIIRYFAYIISILPIGLGFIWIAFDNKKQAWHDKIAKTVVIYHR